MNKDSILTKINPMIKLILMIIPSVIVTFSYDIYIPLTLFVTILILSCIFGKINILNLIKKIMKFFLIGLSFSLFIIFTRAFTVEGLNKDIIVTAISLCLRIMVFSLTSIVFVLTTDSNEFALSLIHQLKLSYKIVYPFLVAYRFIPTFQNELEKIILAKEVRGITSKNGVFSSVVNFPKYILPMLSSAIRKGERASMSMESRGFGKYEDRTYYDITTITVMDYKAIMFFSIISIFIIYIGIKLSLVQFRLGLVLN